MNKIIFICDFFLEHIVGGGELSDNELINILTAKNHDVKKIQSHLVTENFLDDHSDCFFIVGNFINLPYVCKRKLTNLEYIIYEHDHKYLKSRNPANYRNFKAPIRDIINYSFYKNAKKVLCQSKFHKEIMTLNLDLDNIESVGGNLWSIETLSHLAELSSGDKDDKCSIMKSSTGHKNTSGAVQYCESKKLEYELIQDGDYFSFLEKLSKNRRLVFLPKTPETLSRVVVEARMMGVSVITNSLVGASSEPWFKMKGEELIEYMVKKREEITSLVELIIDAPKVKKEKPLISIIGTFYKGEKFLEGYLQDLVEQTIFDKCEVVLVDTGSPGREKEIIEKYSSKYSNIKYYRYDERLRPTVGFNLAIKKSSADLISWAFLDDRRRHDCLEVLYGELKDNNNIDLVYGDSLLTDVENERFDETKSKRLAEHSSFEFSKENMIKCLPGIVPLWRRKIHENNGFFDQDGCNFADDWEMWLRAVDSGSVFKKVNEVVGLCLEGGRSQQKDNLEQRKEEAGIFFKYAHLFGHNYQKYRQYFQQFLGT